jgi:HSP20 family protein
MAEKKEIVPRGVRAARDPFAVLRQMTAELGEAFDRPFRAFGWPALGRFPASAPASWVPDIDVFERDNQLVTKVDLPGLKKEDVKVEVTEGYLTISGERRTETEEEKDNVYRSERSYGSFYRAVPMPEGAKLEDVKATFFNGVLEVSVPLPAARQEKARTVQIGEPAATKPAAA